MHLTLKSIWTHLYTSHAVIIIYMAFRQYCRKWGRRLTFLQKGDTTHRAPMITKAGYVIGKAFFLITKLQSIMADIFFFLKKMLESAKFFFILQQCHKCSVRASSPQMSQICACLCIVSVQFVFPFLVFFVLLFARTFNTEPWLVLRRGCKDPNTGPER